MIWRKGTTARAVAVLFKSPLVPLYRCTSCKQDKPREAFSTLTSYNNKAGVPTYRRASWCRVCAVTNERQRRRKVRAKGNGDG